MNESVTKRVVGAELSTVRIGDVIETMAFLDNGDAFMIDRTGLPSLAVIQEMHWKAFVERMGDGWRSFES